MSDRPRQRWVLLSFAFLVLVGFGWRTSGRENEGDLRVYYETVGRVARGLDLYQMRETAAPERPTGYIYPPLFALVFLPFTYLPFAVLRGLWFVLMGVCALRSFWVSVGLVRRGRPPPEGRRWALALALGGLVALRFAWSDLGHGQANLLVIWLTLEGVRLAEGGRDRWAGAFLAVAVLIKLTPAIVLAGYLLGGRRGAPSEARAPDESAPPGSAPRRGGISGDLFGRRWQLLAGAAVAGAIGLLAPSLVLGLDGNLSGLARFVTGVTAWNAEYHAYTPNNTALTALLKRVLVGWGNAGQPPQRMLLSVDPHTVRLLCVGVSVGALALFLALTRRLDSLTRAAVLLAAIPLVSPVAWKPHLVCAILPALLAARLLVEGPPRRVWPLAVALACLGATGRVPLGRDLSHAFTLWGGLTLGMLCLAFGLWWRSSSDGLALERERPPPVADPSRETASSE